MRPTRHAPRVKRTPAGQPAGRAATASSPSPPCWADIVRALACRAVRHPARSEVYTAMKRVTEIERAPAGELSAPDLLTVEEAADVVRIGRTAAYRLARQYLASDGATGIPAVQFGKQLRMPRCRLEAALGRPITSPLHEPKPTVELAQVDATQSPTKRAPRSRPIPVASPRLFSV